MTQSSTAADLQFAMDRMLSMSVEKLSELHDACLVGLAYLAGASIRLDFEKVDLTKTSVSLTGVVHFFCTGMLEGNIVESVEVIDTNDVSADDLEYFVKKEGRGQSVDALRQTINSKRLSMVLLGPSYGAELGCVCSAVVR
jgi:hypothetical protein